MDAASKCKEALKGSIQKKMWLYIGVPDLPLRDMLSLGALRLDDLEKLFRRRRCRRCRPPPGWWEDLQFVIVSMSPHPKVSTPESPPRISPHQADEAPCGWRLWGGDSGECQRRLYTQRGASEIISIAPCGWRLWGGDSLVGSLGWGLWGGDSGVETLGGASDDLGPNAEPPKLFPKLPVGGDSAVETLG